MGFLGVNFFFAISEFVICLIASKDTFSVRSFVIKRAFRIYPLYFAAMASVAFMILIGRYPKQDLIHFLYSLTLLPQNGAPPYDVSWTLECELVFYALAAIIIPIAGIPGLAVVLAGLAMAGLYYGNPWSYRLISTHQADFLGGVLVFMLSRYIRPSLAASIAAVCAGSFLLWYTRRLNFAFSGTVPLGLILLGMVHLQLPWKHWSLRWLVQLGDASYSIYLWHLLGFMISFILSFKITDYHPDWLCEPWRFGAIICISLFSILRWRKIEKPMIKIGNRLALYNPKYLVAHDQRWDRCEWRTGPALCCTSERSCAGRCECRAIENRPRC